MSGQRLNEIAVIIVNWNRWQLSLECLEKLRTTQDIHWHLYLVDNASTDGSDEKLKNLGSDVTYIQSPINGGWTGGNNLGVKRALENDHKYLLVLNNDAHVEPNTLKVLRDAMAAGADRPIIGPMQKHSNGSGYSFTGAGVDERTGMPGHPRTLDFDSAEASALPEYQPTAYVQGSGIFATAEHFNRVGLFDDRFYLNYDDTDWCFRARKEGIYLFMLKAAQIEHDGSGTIGGAWSPINVYFMTRNGLLFSKLHSTPGQRRRYLRRVVREGLDLTDKRRRLERLPRVLLSPAPRLRAYRRALLDYAFGRFGNCPDIIRKLQAAAGKD